MTLQGINDEKTVLPIVGGFEVKLQKQVIDVNREIEPLTRNASVGAVASFIGVVRDHGDTGNVTALEIEHYPGMTEKVLWSIVKEATARWGLQAAKVVHRVGCIGLGESIVLVITASEHRAASFTACEYVMDLLKSRATFWKKEIGYDGQGHWVEAKARDARALNRWG